MLVRKQVTVDGAVIEPDVDEESIPESLGLFGDQVAGGSVEEAAVKRHVLAHLRIAEEEVRLGARKVGTGLRPRHMGGHDSWAADVCQVRNRRDVGVYI